MYLTDLTVQPDTIPKRQYVADQLHMSYDNTEAYIVLSIDVNRIGLLTSPSVPNQFCYPSYWPSGLTIDGTRVVWVASWVP